MLTIAYLSILFLYSLATGLLYYWWRQIETPGVEEPQSSLFLSVIVVIRNEEANIQNLLADLEKQQYAPSGFEVIVVDDHSTDASFSLVEQVAEKSHLSIRLFRLEDAAGKKAGLSLGVHQAKGEVVLVTDGDCRLPSGWLQSYGRSFANADVRFVSGPVTFCESKNFFAQLQTIEFASLVGTGAAFLKAGFPGMCNAANMAFRKNAYLEAEHSRTDFHIPSGDDEFLLQAIYNKYPRQVYFLKSREAVVQTIPQPDWKAFVQQRKRWAGKWRLHRKPAVAATALSLFLFYTAWIGLLLNLLLSGQWFLFFGGVLLKFSIELLFLQAVMGLMGKKIPWLALIFLQLVYPFYVLYFGVAVNFGSFSWKGRTYKYASV
ncbi:glycosyltransferase [Nafulsella turpanensis]|uniref:glycosyltransferase n=1 Tax=Nafulsella turpanensis TaxID=1265690 RepID=UPI00034A527F|nr:glycosyltransferase [Nafulsella turpanensis]